MVPRAGEGAFVSDERGAAVVYGGAYGVMRTGFAGRVADERVLFDRTKEYDGPAQVLQRVINAAQEMAKRMRTRSQEIAC